MEPALLREVAARASTPAERGGPQIVLRPDRPLAEARLEAWADRGARGDRSALRRRLALEGLSEAEALARLGAAAWREGAPLPTWTGPLRHLAASPEASGEPGADDPAPGDPALLRPLPFHDALAPLVRGAVARCAPLAACEPGVQADRAHALLVTLCTLAAPPLLHEFGLFRAQRRVQRVASGGDALYRAFVGHLLSGDWGSVLLEYAALARAMGTAVLQWEAETTELLARLRTDADALAHAFARGRALGAPVRVEPLGSDRHGGGRTVQAVTFENGVRVVYKPRPLDLDAAVYALARGLALDLDTPACLLREGYGWMEWVEPDERGGARYASGGGALLALAHALSGIDLHHENVVPRGGRPVLVDAETLFYPRTAGTDAHAPSVLDTDLLPREGDRGTSALGPQRAPEAPAWHAINTDAMAYAPPPPPKVAPGAAASGDDVAAGFEAAYRAVLRQRRALRATDGWARACRASVRYLPRSTAVYHEVLYASLRPAALRSGPDRWIELDRLGRVLVDAPDPGRLLPLVHAERRALARLDVPYFPTPVASRALHLSGARLPGWFSRSGAEEVTARLDSLGEADLTTQTARIRAALPPTGRPPTGTLAPEASGAGRGRP